MNPLKLLGGCHARSLILASGERKLAYADACGFL